jgi:hypothetical protein
VPGSLPGRQRPGARAIPYGSPAEACARPLAWAKPGVWPNALRRSWHDRGPLPPQFGRVTVHDNRTGLYDCRDTSDWYGMSAWRAEQFGMSGAMPAIAAIVPDIYFAGRAQIMKCRICGAVVGWVSEGTAVGRDGVSEGTGWPRDGVSEGTGCPGDGVAEGRGGRGRVLEGGRGGRGAGVGGSGEAGLARKFCAMRSFGVQIRTPGFRGAPVFRLNDSGRGEWGVKVASGGSR